MNARRRQLRRRDAPRRAVRPTGDGLARAIHLHVEGAPTEVLDVVTGPYERRIVDGATRPGRRP